jgi:hypothetical protein
MSFKSSTSLTTFVSAAKASVSFVKRSDIAAILVSRYFGAFVTDEGFVLGVVITTEASIQPTAERYNLVGFCRR